MALTGNRGFMAGGFAAGQQAREGLNLEGARLGIQQGALALQERQLQMDQESAIREQAQVAFDNSFSALESLVASSNAATAREAIAQNPGMAQTLITNMLSVAGPLGMDPRAVLAQVEGLVTSAQQVTLDAENAVLQAQTTADALSAAGVETSLEDTAVAQGLLDRSELSGKAQDLALMTQVLGRPPSEEEAKRFFGIDAPAGQRDKLVEVIDKETGEVTFALESEVMANTERFAPMNNGLLIEATGDGGFRVSTGGAGQDREFAPLGAGDRQSNVQRLDLINNAVTITETLINSEAAFGLFGALERGAQTLTRLGEEIPGLESVLQPFVDGVGELIVNDDIEAEALTMLQPEDPSAINEAEVLENRLIYMYARAVLQPEGKLLASTVEKADEAIELFSLFDADESVRDRLRVLLQEFRNAGREFETAIDEFQDVPATSATQGVDLIFNAETGTLEPAR